MAECNLSEIARQIYADTRDWAATVARLENLILDDEELTRRAANSLAREAMRSLKHRGRVEAETAMREAHKTYGTPRKFDAEVMRRTGAAVDAHTYYSYPLSNGVLLGDAYPSDVRHDRDTRRAQLGGNVARWLFDGMILEAMGGRERSRVRDVLVPHQLLAMDQEAVKQAAQRLRDPLIRPAKGAKGAPKTGAN